MYGQTDEARRAPAAASVPVWGRAPARPARRRPGRGPDRRRAPPAGAPGPVDGPQRVGLAVGAVVGLGQQHPALLPERLAAGEGAGQRGGLVDPAVAQEGRRQPLFGAPAQLRQAGGLVAPRPPAVQLDQRLALEQPERFPQERHRPGVLPDRDQLGGLLVPALEEAGVDLVVADDEPVPVGRRLDGPGPQQLPSAQDRALDDLAPGRRRVVAVESLGQAVDRHGGGAGGHEGGQHDPVTTTQGLLVPVDPARSQHPDAHGPTMGVPGPSVNAGVTGALPQLRDGRDRPPAGMRPRFRRPSRRGGRRSRSVTGGVRRPSPQGKARLPVRSGEFGSVTREANYARTTLSSSAGNADRPKESARESSPSPPRPTTVR